MVQAFHFLMSIILTILYLGWHYRRIEHTHQQLSQSLKAQYRLLWCASAEAARFNLKDALLLWSEIDPSKRPQLEVATSTLIQNIAQTINDHIQSFDSHNCDQSAESAATFSVADVGLQPAAEVGRDESKISSADIDGHRRFQANVYRQINPEYPKHWPNWVMGLTQPLTGE